MQTQFSEYCLKEAKHINLKQCPGLILRVFCHVQLGGVVENWPADGTQSSVQPSFASFNDRAKPRLCGETLIERVLNSLSLLSFLADKLFLVSAYLTL